VGRNGFFFRGDKDISGQEKVNKILEGLNQAQREAVAYNGGSLLVLAGAGSGKTRVLIHRAAWLVSGKKSGPTGLLLLTFTNKAAAEMKQRLEKLLGDIGAENLSGLFAGTFHSFCAYLLRKEGRKVGIENSFVIFDEADQKALIRSILKAMDLSEKEFKLGSVKAVIEGAKNDFIPPETFMETRAGFWAKSVGRVYGEYQRRLRKMKGLDFSDLLYFAVELLRQKENVLEKYRRYYKYILIDEYQDTNKTQYMLTKLLAGEGRSLTVVGDAAQAIYSWRGADYHNLLSLKKDFPGIKVVNLETNYRSTQTILDCAFGIISQNKKHPVLRLVTKNGRGRKVCVYRADTEVREAEFVAEKIKALIDIEGVDPTKIAVLYRTNAQSRVFEEVFIRQGLAYILIGGVRFYDRAEVKDVLSLLRVYYNPADQISWQRIEKNMGKRRRAKVEIFLEKNKENKWPAKKILAEILAASAYEEKLDPDKEDGARRQENINELASVAEKFPRLEEFLENVALVQQEYSVQEKEKKDWSDQAIKLMTLHASKGLEFMIVFLVGMEEGLLPHGQNIDDPEKLEEERRLCYVGITRAQKRLFLSFANRRLYFGQTNLNDPSRFLDDLPKSLTKWQVDEWSDDDWDDEW